MHPDSADVSHLMGTGTAVALVNCICMCMYKALMNHIMQSLAVPVRHHADGPRGGGGARLPQLEGRASTTLGQQRTLANDGLLRKSDRATRRTPMRDMPPKKL